MSEPASRDPAAVPSPPPGGPPQPGAAAAPPFLEVRDLWKVFQMGPKRIEVLRELNWTLERGALASVVGASGVGKSTLLQVLGTLDAPSRGAICFDGVEVTRMTASDLARFRNSTIGFVFQFHHLLPEFSAEENVAMPALIRRIDRREALRRAREVLDWVGLGHRMTHRPGELSGGELQRVALARALVMKPELLLADEPTGNLDPDTGQAIFELLFQLNKEMGIAVVMVSHDQRLARRMPQRYLLEGGKLRRLAEDERAFAWEVAGG